MQNTTSTHPAFAGLSIPPGFVLPETVEESAPGMEKLTFPGGFWIYSHAGPGEASLIYNEIMVGGEYFRHGLSLDDARCILDIGGNIGLFTLAAKQRAPRAIVYTFEPIPETFATLELNVRSHGYPDVHLYNLAIGRQDHARQTFTYFPHMPGNATFATEIKDAQRPAMNQVFGKQHTDMLYESEPREVEVRTLSSLIREHGITRIDYLKIDVEGAELAVLDGIAESDWPMIRQVAVETHTEELRHQVAACLAAHGLEVEADLGLSSPIGVSNVYARRA